MITGYKIKKVGDEEILYVYLDFNYEFGNFKKASENLKESIKKFIKKNNIAFKGTLVALVVSGMVTGSMKLNDNDKKLENSNNQVMITERILDSFRLPENINIVNKEEPQTVEPVISEPIIYEESESKNDYTINNTNLKENINDIKISEEINNSIDEEVNDNSINEEINDIQDNKTYVNIKRSSGEIQNIELEEYIIGVVGAEMPASFQIEALKSQAVIARTYALKYISKGLILTDNESTQSYKDNQELQNLWGNSYDTYYNKIKSAVSSTEGMYLTYNGTYIEAVYHSTSNGVTEDASYVWGSFFPYLVSVESQFDNTNPSYIKETSFTYQDLSNKLDSTIDINTEFNILGYTPGKRVESIEINGTIYKGTKFRQMLGLRSTDFDITKTEEGVLFTTRGYGHGVGMSQYGANGMAKNGYTYRDILLHYYPGVVLNY